jgi:ubiquinone/menaquinone biosynthesis C-methylase UbiE
LRTTEGDRWVRDTRFGSWLITSDIWVQYVLRAAVAQLIQLLGHRRSRYTTILDIGCGGGKALPLLDRRFAPKTLVGVDPDPEMITRAGAPAARCRCRVELRLGQATRLDLPDCSLDMIFCHQTFHHIADPDGAAREFYRVLKPGGVLLFSESCAPFIRSLLIRVLFRHPMEAQRLAQEYLALLRSTGFAFGDENVATPYPWWSRPDLGLLGWLGRPVPTRRPEPLLNVAAFKAV